MEEQRPTSTHPKKRFGIFPKLLVCFLLIALIPLLIFATRTIRLSKEAVFEESRNILLFRSTDIANRVSDFLYGCVTDLRTVTGLPCRPESYLEFCKGNHRRIWKRGGTNDRIIEVYQSIPVYREIAFINPVGREEILIRDEQVVPSEALRDVSIPANTTYKCENYFQQTLNLGPGEIFVSHLTGWHLSKREQLGGAEEVESAVEGREYDGVVRFATKIFNADGSLMGIVMISLDHHHLMEFTQHIHSLSESPVVFPNYASGNYAYMFDDEGWIICHPKYWDIRGLFPDGTPVPPYHEGVTSREIEKAGRMPLNLYSMAKWRDPIYNEIMSNILDRRPGLAMITNVGYDEVRPVLRTRAYAPILFDEGSYKRHGVFGGVTVGAEIEAVQRVADPLAGELWMILILTALLVILIAVLMSRRIAGPILELSQAARRIGDGDLEQVVPSASQDEFGDLARTFNRMCAGLKESRERLRRSERFASIGEVISGTAHAIKTELNIYGLINNVSTLARLTPQDDPRGKYVTAVKDGIEGLEQVVHALLEPAPEIIPEQVDLDELTAEVIEAFHAKAEQMKVRISKERSKGNFSVNAQPDLLRQVIVNVAKNALDAMRNGGTLFFRFSREPVKNQDRGDSAAQKEFVVLEVTDTGCGIPERLRHRVFFPFFTTKKDTGGTGLGLYQCSTIIRQHGGEMELTSEEGRGTTVTIRLPAV
ncbi:MAG: sensor histidine kinase [bacterium]